MHKGIHLIHLRTKHKKKKYHVNTTGGKYALYQTFISNDTFTHLCAFAMDHRTMHILADCRYVDIVANQYRMGDIICHKEKT